MPGIYEEIGGNDGVRTAVAVFYQRVVADPDLGRWFEGVDLERLKAHQRAFLGAAFGGPALFGGRGLAEAHAGLEITDAAFDHLVGTLMTALADLGIEKDAVDAVGRRLEEARADVVTA